VASFDSSSVCAPSCFRIVLLSFTIEFVLVQYVLPVIIHAAEPIYLQPFVFASLAMSVLSYVHINSLRA